MSGVFSEFTMKSLLSGFWTAQKGPCPDESVIFQTAISSRGITTLSVAVSKLRRASFFNSHDRVFYRFSKFFVNNISDDRILTVYYNDHQCKVLKSHVLLHMRWYCYQCRNRSNFRSTD